jgi:peptidoglycan/xylan/chitin deacetylase (PgdA/CDA1 family)
MENKKVIVLRMDDVGASSKQFEVYGKGHFDINGKRYRIPLRLSNFLFLKKVKLWTGWGPYRELNSNDWKSIINLLKRYNSKLTVAVTACWVDENSKLLPFPEKFPKAAHELKNGVIDGVIEIANHGLTHCIVGKHLPKLFKPNRNYHREFNDFLPDEMHKEHLQKSQKILEEYFEIKISTLVPPGNQFSKVTVEACQQNGIEVINCHTIDRSPKNVSIISNKHVFTFHDREIVLFGINWFEAILEEFISYDKLFIKELREYSVSY